MPRIKSKTSTKCSMPLTQLKLKSTLGLLILRIHSFALMPKSTSTTMLNSDNQNSLSSEKHPWPVKMSIPMKKKQLKLDYRMFLLTEISAVLLTVLVSQWVLWTSLSLTVDLLLISSMSVVVLMLTKLKLRSRFSTPTQKLRQSSSIFSEAFFPANWSQKALSRLHSLFIWESL